MTADEIEWGRPLKMRTEVNGKVRQDSDTSDLYFGIAKLISYASQAMTLFPETFSSPARRPGLPSS